MKKYLPLGVIIFLAVIFRAIGLNYGLPYPFGHFDEIYGVRQAVAFGAMKTLRPVVFFYPALYSHILLLLYGAWFLMGKITGMFSNSADFAFLYIIKPGYFYLIGRAVSWLAGSLTVYALYRIGKKTHSRQVGLLAALFLAFSAFHSLQSHWAKVDVLMVFLVSLALFFMVDILKKGKPGHYLWGGFFAGLATAAKFNAAPIIFVYLLACFFSGKKNIRLTFCGLGMFLLGFFLGSPYCFLDFKSYYNELLYTRSMVKIGELGNSGTAGWLWIIRDFIAKDKIIAVVSILGFIYALLRGKKADCLFIVLAGLSFIYVGAWRKESLHYFITAVPALFILAAVLVSGIYKKFLSHANRVWVCFLLSFMLLPNLTNILKADYGLIQKDARTTAKEWIEANIPQGARIALHGLRYRDYPMLSSKDGEFSNFDYGPKARGAYQNQYLNDKISQYLASVKTYRLFRIEKDIPEEEVSFLLKGVSYKNDSYVKSCYGQGFRQIKELKALKVEYVILSSFLYGLYTAKAAPPPEHPLRLFFMKNKDYFEKLMSSGELSLVKEFTSPDNPFAPVIKIYKLAY